MDDKYKELREALAAGPTAGPWKAESRVGDWVICQEFDGHALAYPDPSRGVLAEKNAVFIAAANPATIQALLAERDALRSALELSLGAMEHMGDVLNNMDAVEEEDEAATTPAFEAARAALSL